MTKSPLISRFFQKSDQLAVSQKNYRQTVTDLFSWLTKSDAAEQDLTSSLLKFQSPVTAKIICHNPAVIAGIEEISYLVKDFKPLVQDGQTVAKNQAIVQITGPVTKILGFERTIINLLQRLSGIATQTRQLIKLVPSNVFIAATRKTPWGLLDKKGVAIGGGLTHRLNLADGILIKDNHLKLITITQALKTVLPQIERQLIEVEVKTETEAIQTLNAFKSIKSTNFLAIMFDNFPATKIKSAIDRLNDSSVIYEASGGINQTNLSAFAKSGVDIISLGALTHSSRAVDLSLEII